MGGAAVIGIDMAAAIGLAQSRGCDMELFSSCLPEFEGVMLQRHTEDEGETGVRGGDWEEEGVAP